MKNRIYQRVLAGLTFITLVFSLSGCGGTKETEKVEVVETQQTTAETRAPETEKVEATEENTEKVLETELSTEKVMPETEEIIHEDVVQTNSISMLNYLTVLAEEVHQSSNSKLFLESVTDSLLNDLYPNAIDKRTQNYITSMLRNVNDLRMVSVKRGRLAYIYEQNKAAAMKNAMPSPLSLLNVVKSANPLQAIASVAYLAVDAYTSYESATAAAELSYLQDGWDLDDAEDEVISENRIEAFNYMQDIIRDNGLDGDLALNEKAVNRFVEWKNDDNVVSRIQHLEEEQDTYAAYGEYWILLAQSYYENKDYAGCVSAVEAYRKTQPRIFRKDIQLATIMPYAIASLQEVYDGDDLFDKEKEYVELLDVNSDPSNWELKYFVALTYIDLYARTNDDTFIKTAYRIVNNNVNELYKNQLKLNKQYLAEVQEEKMPEDPTERDEEDIKQYNKMLKEIRETELPPVDNAFLMNVQLLFELGEQIGIDDNEKARIDSILHKGNMKLFLVDTMDSFFWYDHESDITIDGSFSGSTLEIPASYVTDQAKIIATINDNTDVTYEDWVIDEVERPKNSSSADEFTASYKSESIDDVSFDEGDRVHIQVFPYGEDFDSVELEFEAEEDYIVFVPTGCSFKLVSENETEND